ncbi:MAG: peptide deformylase [Nitrospiraceae bacterium]
MLINPTIVYYGPEQAEFWEGCLSVDGLRGKVTRPSVVRVTALDRTGKRQDIEASGLYAVCIQHEIDHLIGKVFLDRMAEHVHADADGRIPEILAEGTGQRHLTRVGSPTCCEISPPESFPI